MIRSIALAILTAMFTAPLRAEPAAGPPAWQDGASVYLAKSQPESVAERTTATPAPAENEVSGAIAATANDVRPIINTAVAPAEHEAADAAATSVSTATTKADRRYLAPPSPRFAPASARGTDGQGDTVGAASRRLAAFGIPTKSMYTICTALAIVIGAFLLFSWALRRGGRTMARRRGRLPADVVSVLGRVPLAARQFAELLRVGNKLVLVSLTPTGAETITEVTDPAEVDRLVGLCQQNNPYSTTKAFEQVFQQLSNETTPSGFLGNESLPSSFASPAGVYRAHRGGAARG
ncbi:MAG: flagellar biosynthetic protein FliO [Planctomycetes bacterium]|nr:flagellar biosynthetic protein FliO [Planctomycetota bacterium]